MPITSTAPGLTEDLGGRMRRYWLFMGMRVACMALLFVVPRQWWWLCIVGALVSPLLAVLVANAGREGGGRTPAEHAGQDLVVLDRSAPPGAAGSGAPGSGEPGAADAGARTTPRRAPTYHVRPGEFLR